MKDDIFADIIEGFFGTGEKRAQPRRAVRRRAPPSREPGLDDLVRQFFGIPGEGPAEAAGAGPDPVIDPPPPVPRTEQRPPPRPVPAAPPPPLAATTPPPETAASGPSGRQLAEALRKDAAAARTAFIYSEILGPPMADRLFDN